MISPPHFAVLVTPLGKKHSTGFFRAQFLTVLAFDKLQAELRQAIQNGDFFFITSGVVVRFGLYFYEFASQDQHTILKTKGD